MTEQHPLNEKTCFDIQWNDQADYQDEVDLMRAVYDHAVNDVIKITQGQEWSDYEGTLYYPAGDGIETVGDAIKRELYSHRRKQLIRRNGAEENN